MKFERARQGLVEILLDESAKTGHSFNTLMIELMHAHNEYTGRMVPVESNLIKMTTTKMVKDALLKHGGNQRAAAKSLGMAKSTLHDWLHRDIAPKLTLEEYDENHLGT